MGNLTFGIAAAAALASAADPLVTAMNANGETLCFTRSYDSAWLANHKGQTVRHVRLAFNGRDDSDGPEVRIQIDRSKPAWVFGECHWAAAGANRSAQDDILDPSFKGESGLQCMIFTDTTGVSAEEGGFFLATIDDSARTLQIHLQDSMAAWLDRRFDREGDYIELGPADRIIRLQRSAEKDCADLIALFPAVK